MMCINLLFISKISNIYLIAFWGRGEVMVILYSVLLMTVTK